MSLIIRTGLGYTEVIIDDDGSLKRFYEVANILCDALNIKFISKMDEFDSLVWDL